MTHLLLTLLGVFLGLAAVSAVVGRLAVAALGIRWLRRPTPEAWAFAALVGTGLIGLAFGWCSHLGLPAGPALRVMAVAGAVLVAVVAAQRRLTWLAPPRPLSAALLAVPPIALAVTSLALPVLTGGAYSIISDHIFYASIGEWLQTHGFGTTAPADPADPVTGSVVLYQERSLRMGAVFLLGALRGLGTDYRSWELLVPLVAWGVVLNVGAVLLLCRWCLRLPRLAGLVGGLILAFGFNPYGDGSNDGYLPQTFGVPLIAGCVALLSRLTAPRTRTPGAAVVLGVLTASVVSFYSEAAPALAAVLLAFAAITGVGAARSGRLGAFLAFAAVVVVAVAVLGNGELVRAVRGVLGQMKVHDGRTLPWSFKQFWAYAMGARAWWTAPGGVEVALLTVATSAAFLVGLCRLTAHRRALPLALTLGVFSLMAVAFLFRTDPRTGASWDSWAEFKVCGWAYTFVLAAQCAGLIHLVGTTREGRALAVGAVLGVAACAVPEMREQAARRVEAESAITGSPEPLLAWRALHDRIRAIDPPNVFYVSAPDDGLWPRSLITYAAHPYRFVNGWRGAFLPAPPSWAADRFDEFRPETLVLTRCRPPFEEPVEVLPAGLLRLDSRRPTILHLDNPNFGVDRPGGRPLTWLGSPPARLTVWSPRAGRAELAFVGLSGPSRPDDLRRRLVVRQSTGAERTFDLPPMSMTPAAVVLDLPAGTSTVDVHCPDAPTVDMRWPDGRPYQLLVALEAPRLTFRDTPPQRPAANDGPATLTQVRAP